ncbi:putative peptidyl-tRNA hydrolase PTRHD1 [Pleurodeles waltl]|uniref:putative peptidyl-tRNA hydrolase PTRHD1 n=1 Tax=Pleurodeles waltl TaxID=8319 RepID=UPI003709B494
MAAVVAGGTGGAPQRLVQYVVVRGDLQKILAWPLGALVAQACHAATAAIHLNYSHPHTCAYLQELDCMHKVVLEAPDEGSLAMLAETLTQENIDHKVWIEQPENIATCIALRPYPKEEVHRYFKKLKLLK